MRCLVLRWYTLDASRELSVLSPSTSGMCKPEAAVLLLVVGDARPEMYNYISMRPEMCFAAPSLEVDRGRGLGLDATFQGLVMGALPVHRMKALHRMKAFHGLKATRLYTPGRP